MKKYVIGGNWKMNKDIGDAIDFAQVIKEYTPKDNVEVVVLAPFLTLPTLKKELINSGIKVGAQNCHFEKSGAFTGEVSPLMLFDAGMDYCIVGHSERREYFAETDHTVNLKLKALFEVGIRPILCVGEPLAIREAGHQEAMVADQLELDLEGIPADKIAQLVIAYEPIWAIGTGVVATPDQAEEMCAFIRGKIAELYDQETADQVVIQYGGSMKPENAGEILAKPNIDGGLVGGASLKPESLIAICDSIE
jgi:triosephosphate isomerase